jgi:hypothetical protein
LAGEVAQRKMRLVGGSRFRTVIAIDIETEPEEAPDAAKPDLFRSQAGGATGGNAGHLGEFAHRAKFDIVGRRRLAHAVEPAGNAFGPCLAGLSAAIENFFDSVKSRVVDAFSAAGKVGRRERFPDIADGNRKHPEGKCRSGDGDHESAAIATGGERRRRGSTASRMRRGRSRIGSRLARHWKSRGQADSIRTAMPTRHKLP